MSDDPRQEPSLPSPSPERSEASAVPVAGQRGERVWVDYSHELRMQRNPLLRTTYVALGLVCVALGAIGVVVPGWPTTVWLLVATFFFARSSPRFYNWLMNHRVFGPLIRDWRAGKGLTARAKTLAVATILVTIGISVAVVPPLWLKVLLTATAVALCTYLLTLPTKPLEAAS